MCSLAQSFTKPICFLFNFLSSLGLIRREKTKISKLLNTAKHTLHSAHCILHSAYCTLPSAQSALYMVHCTLHNPHCTLQNEHFTLHTAHCVLNTINCTLHTLHTSHCILQTSHLHTAPRREGLYYEAAWRAAVRCRPHAVAVTTFNGWGEGSQVRTDRVTLR